jgi:hypothetical protein
MAAVAAAVNTIAAALLQLLFSRNHFYYIYWQPPTSTNRGMKVFVMILLDMMHLVIVLASMKSFLNFAIWKVSLVFSSFRSIVSTYRS